jgi:hypothetical protein
LAWSRSQFRAKRKVGWHDLFGFWAFPVYNGVYLSAIKEVRIFSTIVHDSLQSFAGHAFSRQLYNPVEI